MLSIAILSFGCSRNYGPLWTTGGGAKLAPGALDGIRISMSKSSWDFTREFLGFCGYSSTVQLLWLGTTMGGTVEHHGTPISWDSSVGTDHYKHLKCCKKASASERQLDWNSEERTFQASASWTYHG